MRLIKSKIALTALLFSGCASADAQRSKADVSIESLPPAVTAAAHEAVEGIHLVDAKLRKKRWETVYKLEGIAAGKDYELKVTAAGEVLDVSETQHRVKKSKGADEADAADAPPTPFRQIATIQHPAVKESSGIVASRKHPGVLWTHNDKGNAATLYAINKDGEAVAEFPVASVNDDWEDVAIDDHGTLYIGRIGNNDAAKDTLEVLSVAEPDPSKPAAATLEPQRTWRLKFPAQPFDCESLFVHGEHGYVISKRFEGASSELYRFPLNAGTEVTLEKISALPTQVPVTAADISPDGKTLAILGYGQLYLVSLPQDPSAVGAAQPQVVNTPRGKLEGACFTADGILITAESRQIYLLSSADNPALAQRSAE